MLTLGFLAACAAEDKLTLTPTRYDALPGWSEDNHPLALATFLRSCESILKKEDTATQGKGDLSAPVSLWKPACQQAEETATLNASAPAREFFEREFLPFTAANNDNPEGLFTGYYEPLINGSLTRHGKYQTPVYKSPPERVDGTPFLTREEIENGALAGRGLELLWTDDPVKLFFMQIQGSGRVKLEDGREIKLGYGGGNGYPYTAIGKVMIERGLLAKEELTMTRLRQWLWDHPNEAKDIMNQNASYVFFRRYEGDGPIGAQKVALTPGRSLAVDSRFIPMGAPLFMDTTVPYGAGEEGEPFRRLFVAQDTGGAIKGPVRADVFFGYGAKAELMASGMKNKGRYTLLLPKAVAEYVGLAKPEVKEEEPAAGAEEKSTKEAECSTEAEIGC